MSSAPATATIPGYVAGTWKADPAHSVLAFTLRQFRVSTVRERFTGFDVTIVTSEDPRGSSVAAMIDVTSLDTGNERRDSHLRSADHFDVGEHPTMSYRSTGIRRTGDGWVVDGELTFRGVTRQVPLAVEPNGFGPGPSGGRRADFSATAQINRRDFGIRFPMDGVGGVIGEKVSISLGIEAVAQK
ncbi:YceI family protein [Streptomyces brevispora]|uniref:Polyisoprenoid-binding protein YceI n=1 Tax=Streptomyces brevispora TaxID=887462 RepID=A0A561TU73_9ACTN|nr:YceI family protein [Streptomyces brevispora]TWF90662.1 polyisoprenoid-binding protein YceI [Streptomyces brevispora]WSC11784.1 YceI family protein [Streptomyces brevispora]